ncbi:dihydroxy-acid dehydratase, partial [Klebsiella pneumoniae]|uniref:dihydroxy-acid dehydratase n=1 Tax=Klebsiella pneumoniae TaxID=573 RepID=UPI002109FAAE
EDRKKDGIVPVMAVGKNITLAALNQFTGAMSSMALLESEAASYHAPGTCTFYGTANTNQMDGAFPGCGVAIHYVSGDADPLFQTDKFAATQTD